jgi:hypothetical protein
MLTETHHTVFQIDGKRFALFLRNDGETFQVVVYRAEAVEAFDVEACVTTQGKYATEAEVVAHIRSLTYLWEN